MASTYPASGSSTRYHVIVGRPVEVVCDLANREQVDMVVLGSRGMTGPAHAIFGSTTEGVLLRSDVSVLVVPASWKPPRPDTPNLTGPARSPWASSSRRPQWPPPVQRAV